MRNEMRAARRDIARRHAIDYARETEGDETQWPDDTLPQRCRDSRNQRHRRVAKRRTSRRRHGDICWLPVASRRQSRHGGLSQRLRGRR
jgi:hypothetical protein